jgi:hypothetical protein
MRKEKRGERGAAEEMAEWKLRNSEGSAKQQPVAAVSERSIKQRLIIAVGKHPRGTLDIHWKVTGGSLAVAML